MNEVYRNLILARAQAAIGAAGAVTGIGHSGLKGQLREIVIRDLFRPLLPANFGLGTGQIITSCNQQSQQQDVVIFDKSIVPPILLEETTGIFPIESVLFAIEIKTELTAEELKSSIQSANQLRSLYYLPGQDDSDELPIELEPSVQAIIPAILAFRSDLSESGKTELERFTDLWHGAKGEPPPIQMICVVGRGCWTWRTSDAWRAWPRSYPLAEVVVFISVIMNSYKQVALSRKAPRMGLYLL
jgi:hypothetical protein